jgi:hypothetical protein
MTGGTWVLVGFGLIWVWGWIASVCATSVGQMQWGIKKIGNIILLFFIWWYIAFQMMNEGDH